MKPPSSFLLDIDHPLTTSPPMRIAIQHQFVCNRPKEIETLKKKTHAKTYSEPSQKKLRKIHLKLNDNVPHYFPMFIQKLYEV